MKRKREIISVAEDVAAQWELSSCGKGEQLNKKFLREKLQELET